MKRVVSLLGTAVIGLLANGCATTGSGVLMAPEAGEYQHIDKLKAVYGPRGDFKRSNDYYVFFSARKHRKLEPANLLDAYCRNDLMGRTSYFGPTLVERRGRFTVCEVDGKPAFLYFNDYPEGSAGQTDRFLLEKRRGVSDEAFLQHLISKGYKPTPGS